jgi:hypothetical protein
MSGYQKNAFNFFEVVKVERNNDNSSPMIKTSVVVELDAFIV